MEEIHALAHKSRSKGKGRKRKAEEERPAAATETVDSALQFIKQATHARTHAQSRIVVLIS